jgi:hypothetical protein
MTTSLTPGFEEFLHAPAEQVAAVAPTTMCFAPGGTRREAVLAGISPQSDEYPRWSYDRMIASIDIFFRLGVRHLFVTALRFPQLAEVGRYRDRLIDWLDSGLASPAALANYAERGWRVRLVGAEGVPGLRATEERLCAATPARWSQTLWMYVSGTPDAHWSAILAAAQQVQARTRAEVVRALYGEDVPLCTLCLSYGKPMLAADIMPLIIADEVQCYWTQRPGFALDERLVRQVFYDYAYTRRTWQPDKSTRYADVLAQQSVWEQPRVLGLGRRVGAFWYPTHDNIAADNAMSLGLRNGSE